MTNEKAPAKIDMASENRQKAAGSLYRFYIGSNNLTGEIETNKIRAIFDANVAGYTYIPALGVWNGTGENSAIIEVSGLTENKVLRICRTLKDELQQQAIGLQLAPLLRFV